MTAFEDIDSNSWYSGYISYLTENQAITGDENNCYRPEDYITRGEFAAIAARYLNLSVLTENAYSDCAKHWSNGYITALSQAEIIQGYEDGSFRPDSLITRAEAVQIINGMLGRTQICPKADNPFSDVPQTHWAYEQIAEAASDHKSRN